MVAQNRLTKQIDSEVLRLMNKLIIEPLLAMVIVLSTDGILAEEKTPPHRAIHDVDDCDFVRCKYLNTSQPSLIHLISANESINKQGRRLQNQIGVSTKCGVPLSPCALHRRTSRVDANLAADQNSIGVLSGP